MINDNETKRNSEEVKDLQYRKHPYTIDIYSNFTSLQLCQIYEEIHNDNDKDDDNN